MGKDWLVKFYQKNVRRIQIIKKKVVKELKVFNT